MGDAPVAEVSVVWDILFWPRIDDIFVVICPFNFFDSMFDFGLILHLAVLWDGLVK